MKKHQLRNWLLVGAMGAALFACQSKKGATPPAPPQEPTQNEITPPCSGNDCPEPPESNSVDKVPCRENECDEQEAGEEAMIHVIEISEPEENKDTAVESVPESTLVNEEKSAAVEPATPESTPVNQDQSAAAERSPEANLNSEESPAPSEINQEAGPFTEEPTTHIFEEFQNNPISENTVVLFLEE